MTKRKSKKSKGAKAKVDGKDMRFDEKEKKWNDDTLGETKETHEKKMLSTESIPESKEEKEELQEVVKYELAQDGEGLKGIFKDGSWYHIHSNELTEKERKIRNRLVPEEKEVIKKMEGRNVSVKEESEVKEKECKQCGHVLEHLKDSDWECSFCNRGYTFM